MSLLLEPDAAIDSTPPHALLDRFGRRIRYLRISVTDRCDLRCVYCMAEDMQFVPRERLLSLEEIVRIGRAFIAMGVEKIRITGGEPLSRRNVLQVFRALGAVEGLRELTLTTNATRLPEYAPGLYAAGVRRINVSLDTLRPDRYARLTRVGRIERVFAGLQAAEDAGIERIKLNAVILKHRNDDEVVDLVEYAHAHGYDISFIEEMPLGQVGDHDRAEAYYSSDAILGDLRRRYDLRPIAVRGAAAGPANYFQVPGEHTRVGFISPHSHNFCAACNRVRLTAEGRLLLCLGQEHSKDLRAVVRDHPGDDAALRQAILESMDLKPKGHAFDLGAPVTLARHMSHTGG